MWKFSSIFTYYQNETTMNPTHDKNPQSLLLDLSSSKKLRRPSEQNFYGEGLIFSNGYKMISHGGGCSGEDCNVTFIVSPEDKLVAKLNW